MHHEKPAPGQEYSQRKEEKKMINEETVPSVFRR